MEFRFPCLRLIFALGILLAMMSPISAVRAVAQSDDLTCDDFTNQDAAQIVLEASDEFADALDEDDDGEACPDLPPREDGAGSEFELTLGYPRVTFEDLFGEATDASDAEEYAVGDVYDDVSGFRSISVYWDEDFAAHIVVELEDELAEDDAYYLALQFLPESTDLDTDADELEEGELLFAGVSDELEDFFDADIYEAYEVGGDPGDIRVILIPGDDDIAVLDIGIGTGDEYAAGGTATEPDDDADAYLESVRESTDILIDEVDTFTSLFAKSELTDDDLDRLIEILQNWESVSDLSSELTAPDGYEEIQTTFDDATAALENVTAEFSVSDDIDVEAAIEFLTEAEVLLTDLDDLLADEGF